MQPTEPPAHDLAYLRGFLEAFAWVNGKTNHGYTFEIDRVEDAGEVEDAVAKRFARDEPSKIALTKLVDWRGEVAATLERWLLRYLRDDPRVGHLEDARKAFSLSHPSFIPDLIAPLVNKIASLSSIQRGFGIDIKTDRFYACESTDMVLVASDSLIFLHFDWCD